MFYVPAEMIIEPPTLTCCSWTWAICQPDAHWAEYTNGKSCSKEQALKDASNALATIHYKQKRGLI